MMAMGFTMRIVMCRYTAGVLRLMYLGQVSVVLRVALPMIRFSHWSTISVLLRWTALWISEQNGPRLGAWHFRSKSWRPSTVLTGSPADLKPALALLLPGVPR